MALFNSLVLNYYIRNKISANVNLFYLYELPIPKVAEKLRAKLAAAAEKLLASPHDAKERARLEVLVAREAYGLAAADWQHLTGTFTYGSGGTKAELEEIIGRSCEFWRAGGSPWESAWGLRQFTELDHLQPKAGLDTPASRVLVHGQKCARPESNAN